MADHDIACDVTWIVLKNGDLGKQLASLTPAGLEKLRTDFERTYAGALAIAAFDGEPDERDSAWPGLPRFEITLRIQRSRILLALDNLTEAVKRQLAYEIAMHVKFK